MPLPMFEKRKSTPKKIKRTIAIAAGKGGVGKSTVTVNVARALRLMGFSVGIIDADIYGPSIRKMLPEDRMPSQKGEVLIPALCDGIPMISMAYFRKEEAASVVRAPIANGIISQFMHQIEWGDLDYLLIDFPPGTGDIQLTIAQKANLTGAVLVATPQEIAIMDVKKAMNMFDQVQVPIIGIIENMSGYHAADGEILYLFGKGGGEKLAKGANVPYLGAIPIDPELNLRADLGLSIFAGKKDSFCTAADPIFEIAKKIHEQIDHLENCFTIKRIFQKEDTSFILEWSDGLTSNHRLSELQKNCPCAKCAESPEKIDPNVGAKNIKNVGRYAIQIEFTSGCSSGIYSLDTFRKDL